MSFKEKCLFLGYTNYCSLESYYEVIRHFFPFKEKKFIRELWFYNDFILKRPKNEGVTVGQFTNTILDFNLSLDLKSLDAKDNIQLMEFLIPLIVSNKKYIVFLLQKRIDLRTKKEDYHLEKTVHESKYKKTKLNTIKDYEIENIEYLVFYE